MKLKRYKVTEEKKGILKKDFQLFYSYKEARDFFLFLEVTEKTREIALYEGREKLLIKGV